MLLSNFLHSAPLRACTLSRVLLLLESSTDCREIATVLFASYNLDVSPLPVTNIIFVWLSEQFTDETNHRQALACHRIATSASEDGNESTLFAQNAITRRRSLEPAVGF